MFSKTGTTCLQIKTGMDLGNTGTTTVNGWVEHTGVGKSIDTQDHISRENRHCMYTEQDGYGKTGTRTTECKHHGNYGDVVRYTRTTVFNG